VDALHAHPLRGALTLSRYDVIHLNMFVPRSRMAFVAYAALRPRILFVDHTSGGSVLNPPLPPSRAKALIRRVLDFLTAQRLWGLAGVSDYVSDRNRRRFGLTGARVRTLYNGIDVERFRPTNLLRPSEFTVVCVAHLIPQKGIHHLLDAFARMARNVPRRLVVVGDGPEAAALASQARALGVSHQVEFLGLRSDVPQLLGRADVFVHPAVWAEAYGLTITEAMAMERPVIASAVGGIPELIVNGDSGLLVPPGDVAGLAAALDRLAEDPTLRRRLGTQARLRVVERFNLRQCVRGHIDWCEEAMGRTAPRATWSPVTPAVALKGAES
jgi:L-malate glycosyltransferase